MLMDARHANAALSTRPIKSDRCDACGLAEMLHIGWYRAVTAKSFSSHERLARLDGAAWSGPEWTWMGRSAAC
ncbi:hypothetical protein ACFQU2_28410 [Siccirubricoccus deserti]